MNENNKDGLFINADKATSNALPENKKEKSVVLKAFLKLLLKLAVVIAVIVSLFTFVFGICRINDTGMTPAVQPGDMIMFYRLDKKYAVSEVVVYNYKNAKTTGRVVGMPGDTINIDENGLKVNGNTQYEPKIFKETLAVKDGTKYPVKLGEDEYFVLGDNRDKAADSRVFGAVKKKDLNGKVFNLIRRRNF